MKVHAIQTGWVKIKTAQPEGYGRGIFRQLAIFADRNWTDWAPTYAWLIDHKEGPIVVDTGQGAHLLDHGRSLHPYVRWEVAFRIDPEEEIGPRLKAIGIAPRDVRKIILTHLHMDHDGGLRHFPDSKMFVAPGELALARGWMGNLRGYLPNRWPAFFDPAPLALSVEPHGPFAKSMKITESGDVIAVATPGHTANHVSVLAYEDDAAMLLAGDASYSQDLMLAGKVDGVSPDVATSAATLAAIRQFAVQQPTIYLPTHDPESATRLAQRVVVPRPATP